ncbi:PAS domain S-box-containing protein [Neorhizobium galegae]|uniref:PAS domain-containing protein n=1 Tax=Neorhizobium galegae TaxID=399 RepID=UPI001AE279FB|nr:PAS domain-containing protein [Neorhizobium galegae]MBP2560634.1 PAS domain S-box-containing protein [Neorhizobium galegae]MDQ0133408.1 PAS domain S-box-containing protein [Neorhizobium galegae]
MSDFGSGEEDMGSDDPNSLGFYSWVVPENKVYGDQVIADIFGLSEEELAAGASIERVIRYISEGDRQRVAKAIHDAIVSGGAYRENYRVTHPDGRRIDVIANGRCLRDAEGVPYIYSGTVTIQPAAAAVAATDPLERHCRAALGLATKRRQMLAARYLTSALNVLGK